MDIRLDDKNKQVQVWLTNADCRDERLMGALDAQYDVWARDKYQVAVFRSGSGDLQENTLQMLRYNRRRSAEREGQREKKRSAAMER